MDLPFLNAYLDSIGLPNFRKGCNFAAAGSTIRPPTPTSVSPFSFGVQVAQFLRFKARVLELLSKGIFVVHQCLAFNFETCSGKTYWYKERNIMNIFRLTSFFIMCRQETCQVPPKGRLFWEGALHVWYRPEWSCWCILFQIIGSNTCFNSSNFGWVWDRNTGKLIGNYLKLLTRNINCNQWSIEFSPYTWLIGLFFRNCMIKVLGIFGYTTRVLLDACLKM